MSNRARLGFGRVGFFFFFARSLSSSFFPLSSAADPLTSRARHRRVSEKGGGRRRGMRRARESPPTVSAPRRATPAPLRPRARRGRTGCPLSRLPCGALDVALPGDEGTHARPRHSHSAASRGGPCGGFPGQRGHGAAAPCPRGGAGKPFLLGISAYRRWRRPKDGRGKLRAWGEAPGDGESSA